MSASLHLAVVAARSVDRRQAKHFSFKGTNVIVPYLEYSRVCRDGKRRSYFTLFYRDEIGARRRETRSTFAKAQARAEAISKIIARGETNLLGYRQADHASLLRCKEILVSARISPELACSNYARWIQKAGDPAIVDAALDFYFTNRPKDFVPKAVPDLVTEFVAEKETAIGGKWHRQLQSQLERFAKSFNRPLNEISSGTINEWLRSLKADKTGKPVGAHTRKNYRAAINELVLWAKANGYLLRTWSEMDLVIRPEPKGAEIKILTPEQLLKLLAVRQNSEERRRTRDTLIPFITLAAFAGIRHEEMNGEKALLDWSDIDVPNRRIYVPKDVAKTGRDRIIPMSENLAAWLQPYIRRNGPIAGKISNTCNAIVKLKQKAGVPGDRNTLRKSFISYRLALVKNIAQVAEEAGNSPEKIRSNYNRPRPDSEAKRWFDIFPTTADVLQLSLAFK